MGIKRAREVIDRIGAMNCNPKSRVTLEELTWIINALNEPEEKECEHAELAKESHVMYRKCDDGETVYDKALKGEPFTICGFPYVAKTSKPDPKKECEHTANQNDYAMGWWNAMSACREHGIETAPNKDKPDPIREVYEKYKDNHQYKSQFLNKFEEEIWQAIKSHCEGK